MLPLLQGLAAAEDVRPVLRARFNMPHWFKVQGVSLAETRPAAPPRTPPPGAPPPCPPFPPTACKDPATRGHSPADHLEESAR